jgi:hypothetical protein
MFIKLGQASELTKLSNIKLSELTKLNDQYLLVIQLS